MLILLLWFQRLCVSDLSLNVFAEDSQAITESDLLCKATLKPFAVVHNLIEAVNLSFDATKSLLKMVYNVRKKCCGMHIAGFQTLNKIATLLNVVSHWCSMRCAG
jgi:hypothetical protein